MYMGICSAVLKGGRTYRALCKFEQKIASEYTIYYCIFNTNMCIFFIWNLHHFFFFLDNIFICVLVVMT